MQAFFNAGSGQKQPNPVGWALFAASLRYFVLDQLLVAQNALICRENRSSAIVNQTSTDPS
jgi:hypothetical protein